MLFSHTMCNEFVKKILLLIFGCRRCGITVFGVGWWLRISWCPCTCIYVSVDEGGLGSPLRRCSATRRSAPSTTSTARKASRPVRPRPPPPRTASASTGFTVNMMPCTVCALCLIVDKSVVQDSTRSTFIYLLFWLYLRIHVVQTSSEELKVLSLHFTFYRNSVISA